MRVAVLQCECGYENEIVNALSALGHDVSLFASSDLIRSFKHSFSSLEHNDAVLERTQRLSYDCFVVNSKDSNSAHILFDYAMSQFPGSIRGPKIIMITSLLSWSGRRYHVPVGTSVSEFTSRVPSARETDVYRIENMFHSCQSVTGLKMSLIGAGLVYGGCGFDFQQLFQLLWDSSPTTDNTVFSLTNGENYLPTIHYQDLAQIIAHVCTNPISTLFIPATDYSSATLQDTITALVTVTKRKIRPTTKDEALEILLQPEGHWGACAPRVWNLDIRFSDSHRLPLPLGYPAGLVEFTSEVWREFVSASTNKPCSILVAGPPSCLKTTVAMGLAERLGIAYVDRTAGIRYVIQAAAQADAARALSTDAKGGGAGGGDRSAREEVSSQEAMTDALQTLDVSTMDATDALFIELRRAIAVQMAAGDKKKKGVDEQNLDLTGVELTDSLVDALPMELLKMCTKNLLLGDPICSRLGYVLDTWTMITDISHIYEITNTRPDKNDPRLPLGLIHRLDSVGEDESQASGSVARSCKTTGTEPIMEQLPRLIVELKTTKDAAVDRLLASFGCDSGATKLTKEQQAVVKELETKLGAYSSLLVDVPVPPPEVTSVDTDGVEVTDAAEGTDEGKKVDVPETPGVVEKSHPVIVGLEGIGYNICRVDVNGLRGRNEDGTVATPDANNAALREVVSQLLDTYCDINGKLDWLLDLKAREDEAAAASDGDVVANPPSEDLARAEVDAVAVVDAVVDVSEEIPLDTVVDQDDSVLVAPVNAVHEINSRIASIKPETKTKLVQKVDAMQNYLMVNVLPHLAEAIVRIHRERIEDPVLFMADFLQQRGMEVQEKETKDVLDRYLEALAHAEAMEEAAAAELLAISNQSCDA